MTTPPAASSDTQINAQSLNVQQHLSPRWCRFENRLTVPLCTEGKRLAFEKNEGKENMDLSA